MDESARKKSWLVQLLLDPLIRRLVLLALLFFVLIPKCSAFVSEEGEHTALSAEMTAWLYTTTGFGPRNVLLSQRLYDLATIEGISEYNLRSIIAAAAIETPRENFETYEQWIKEVNKLAAVLVGLSKIESSYCRNIGGGVAYDEVSKRLERAKAETPGQVTWWERNLTALERLAADLGIDVLSIPGSIGAGAISCFQLMPINWMHYGGGDYRDSYRAGRYAARYLKDHGYDEDVSGAIHSYNPNAGEPYVQAVHDAYLVWVEPVKTALVLWREQLHVVSVAMTFQEILAWYMTDGAVTIGVVDEFVNPYPGSHVCGNQFGAKISDTYTHWGVDLCQSDNKAAPVFAAHDGQVVLSRFVSRHEAIAFKESDGGYVSASGYVVVLEGILPDGRIIQTIYAHLDPGTIPPLGATLRAGDQLAASAKCSGEDTEYCAGDHLHWGSKIDGDIKNNPLNLLEGIE